MHEEKLSELSARIQNDTKLRDNLRLKANDQNEVEMLQRQITQEYEILKERVQDNMFHFHEHGEGLDVTIEDPGKSVEVLSPNTVSNHT